MKTVLLKQLNVTILSICLMSLGCDNSTVYVATLLLNATSFYDMDWSIDVYSKVRIKILCLTD